jgi:predicted transcriptional regulator
MWKGVKHMQVGNRIMSPLYLDPLKHEALKQLATEARRPRSVLLREAVDDLLRKYARRISRRKETRS